MTDKGAALPSRPTVAKDSVPPPARRAPGPATRRAGAEIGAAAPVSSPHAVLAAAVAAHAPAVGGDLTRRATSAQAPHGHRSADVRGAVDASAAAAGAAVAALSSTERAVRRDPTATTPANSGEPPASPASPSTAAAQATASRGSDSNAAGNQQAATSSAPLSAPPPPAPPSAAQSLREMAASDPSLHAAAIGKNAHLRVEMGAGRELTMRLRVSDGVADVEVGGSAVGALGMRPQELRRALAGEGLTLGQFVSRSADGSTEGRAAATDSSGASANAQSAQALAAPALPEPAPPAPPPSGGASAQGGSFSFNQGRRQWQGETADGVDPATRLPASAVGGTAPASSPDPLTRRRGFHVTA